MKIILQSLQFYILIRDKMKVIQVEIKCNLVFYFLLLGNFLDFIPIKIVFTPIYTNNLKFLKNCSRVLKWHPPDSPSGHPKLSFPHKTNALVLVLQLTILLFFWLVPLD